MQSHACISPIHADAQQEQQPPAKESTVLVLNGEPLVSANGHSTNDQAPLSVKEDSTQPVHTVEPDSGMDPRSMSVSDLHVHSRDVSSASCVNIGQKNAGDSPPFSKSILASDGVPNFHYTPHSDRLVTEHDQPAHECNNTTKSECADVLHRKTESSLSTEESQVTEKNELVLYKTKTHKDQDPKIVERMERLTLDVKKMNENWTEQILKLKQEVKAKDNEIMKLENERRESDKKYEEKIKKLKSLVAELEQKVTEKDHEIKKLEESLKKSETSAERRDLHSQGKHVLQQQIDRLTEEQKQDKQKAEQKEKEMEYQLMVKKYELEQKKFELEQKKYEMECNDNNYKDKIRQVEKERDKMKVEYEQTLRKQAEEREKRAEERTKQIEEEKKEVEEQKKQAEEKCRQLEEQKKQEEEKVEELRTLI